MKNFLKKRTLNIICSLVALVLMWLIWFIAYISVGNDLIVPSFNDTVISLGKCLTERTFWIAFGNTFLRTLIAFLISFVFAAALAVLSVFSKIARSVISAFMVVLRTLPTLAVILLILVWSDAVAAPVIVTFLVLFPMEYSQLVTAIEGVDGGILEMAKVYDIKKSTVAFKIYLPLVSPAVLSQTGSDISLGLKIMVSAEVLCATYKSLGGLMQTAKSVYYDMPRLAALTLCTIVIGIIIDVAFSQLKRVNDKWRKRESGND